MKILPLVLILASVVSAAETTRCRTSWSEHPIAEIVYGVGLGSVPRLEELQKRLEELEIRLKDARVRKVVFKLDGKKTPLNEMSLLRAAMRINGWIKDKKRTGSIELSYEVQFPRRLVYLNTFIEHGHLRTTTVIRGDMKRVKYAKLTMDSREIGGKTRITNTVYVYAAVGRFPCGPITRIAQCVMAREVDTLLQQLEWDAEVSYARHKRIKWNDLSDAFVERFRYGLR